MPVGQILHDDEVLSANDVKPALHAVHVVEPLTGAKRPPGQMEHWSVRCDGAKRPFSHWLHTAAFTPAPLKPGWQLRHAV